MSTVSTVSTALITGASRGLGLALATALADRGWDLVLDARDGPALDRAVRGLPDHARVHAVPGDVADPQHRAELVDAAERRGGVEVLVNNASTLGASPLPPLAELTDDTLRRVLEVNLLAPHALTRDLLPQLLRHRGRVVNLTSDAAHAAYPTWGGYAASKAALEELTHTLAAEQETLRAYAVDPGDMRTGMHQDAFPGEDISDRPDPDDSVPGLLRLVRGEVPSGRYTAAELAAGPHHATEAVRA